MNEQESQSARNVQILNILFGLLSRFSTDNLRPSYSQILSIMSAYCTEEDLRKACKELDIYTEMLKSVNL